MASLLDLVDGLNNSEKRQRQLQLDYWREREEEQKKHNITDLDEYNRELDKIYSAMITDCQNQINDWYMRYATKEGISIADAKKRVSTADQKYYAEKAKEYVANKDFSDKANSEMRLYNLTMKVNRMELLKANLGLAMTGGYSDIEKLTGEFLDKKTLEELKRQAVILGKGVDGAEKHADDIVNASFKNATFSDRLWTDMDSLRQSINVQVQRSLIRGLNPVEIARGFMPELRNDVKKARFATERLARTEMSRVLTDAQMDSFKENGYDEYMIICERTACALCRPFDGQHFPLDEMEVGYNASPFHPNCLCSQAPYMDRDELEQMIREIEAERGDVPAQQEEQQKAEKEIKKAESNALLNKINAIKSKLNGNTPKYADLKKAGKAVIPEVEKAVEGAKKTSSNEKLRTLLDKKTELGKQVTALDRRLWNERNTLETSEKDAINKELKNTKKEIKNLKKQIDAVKAEEATKIPEAVKNVIGQVRKMGIPVGEDVDFMFNYSKSQVYPAVKDAYNRYPSDWVKSSMYKKDGNVRHMSLRKVSRGYYSYYGSEIAISGYNYEMMYETATHELGHFFERTVDGVRDNEAEFYKLRTDGEDLKWLGSGYRRDEKTRKDNFVSAYMGKDYGGDAYELVSMGFEYAYTHPEILLKDPDMAEWIYGMLALL